MKLTEKAKEISDMFDKEFNFLHYTGKKEPTYIGDKASVDAFFEFVRRIRKDVCVYAWDGPSNTKHTTDYNIRIYRKEDKDTRICDLGTFVELSIAVLGVEGEEKEQRYRVNLDTRVEGVHFNEAGAWAIEPDEYEPVKKAMIKVAKIILD